MPDEEIIIPEEKQDADPVADKVEQIKHALSEAQTYAFAKFTEMKLKSEDDVPPVGDAPAVDAPPPKESAFDRELSITREARLLEESGIPYSIAVKMAEAVANDDFEAAGKLMDIYQQDERIKNADAIEAEEQNATLRKIFGLPTTAPAKAETEADKMRRIFGLR